MSADTPRDARGADPQQDATEPNDPQDDLTATRHEITIGGTPLPYTVTAGRIVLRKEQQADESFEGHASRDYLWALGRGSRLSAVQRAAAVARVATLTGLTEDYVDRVNLRPEHVRFFTELLRSRRRTVGRLDGRFTGWDDDYGRAELEYHSDLPYEVLMSRVRPWSYKEFEGAHLYVADKLAAAMRTNPHMRVHVACGYHDGATPYFAAEHTFAHLAIPPELAGNIEFSYFEAGHMM